MMLLAMNIYCSDSMHIDKLKRIYTVSFIVWFVSE